MNLKPGAVTMAEIRAAYPGLGAMADASAEPLADPETSEWLDGPGLARWLEHRGMDMHWLEKRHPNAARAVRAWRDGRSASLDLIDTILLDTDYTLHDIPRELWLAEPHRKVPTRLSDEDKATILRRKAAGEPATELAREYDISPRTIDTWKTRKVA